MLKHSQFGIFGQDIVKNIKNTLHGCLGGGELILEGGGAFSGRFYCICPLSLNLEPVRGRP